MKKVLAMTLVLIMALGTLAVAGPIAGLSLVPAVNSKTSVYFGWQSENEWAATISLETLATWNQTWTIGALWTPALWGGKVNLRAGGDIALRWRTTWIRYKGVSLFLGAEKWISDMVGVYGQLNLSSALNLSPLVGVEVNFWSPPANTTE